MSWRHAGTRALVALGTLVFVLVFNFFLFRAVGDPKKDLIRSRLSPAAREAVIRERGLDQDKLTQFRIYVEQTGQGDLGTSNNSRKAGPRRAHRPRCRTRCSLVGIATVLSSIIGSWMGVVAAGQARQYHGHVAHAGQPRAVVDAVLLHRHPRDLAVRREAADLPDRR